MLVALVLTTCSITRTQTSQAEFTALLAKEKKELLFYLHGMGQRTSLVEATDSMQTNLDSQKPGEVLVVPIDWAAEDHPEQELAGSALRKLFSGLQKEMGSEKTMGLNVMAHSMGNRVLCCMGKSAVEGNASWNEEGLQGKSLLQAAPEDLKNQEDLFLNIFFVAADIPESVFDEPDGSHGKQAEHGINSGVAALAVMTKRMHVLHANKTDGALNQSLIAPRLGSRGPWSSGLGNKPNPVWNKISDALETYEGDEMAGNVDNGNVRVQDCSSWNTEASKNGHSYQFAPEAVAYYLKHMAGIF